MLKIVLKSGQGMKVYASACLPKTTMRSALTAIPTCHRQLSARRIGEAMMLHWYIVAAAYPQVCAVLIIVKWCGLH